MRIYDLGIITKIDHPVNTYKPTKVGVDFFPKYQYILSIGIFAGGFTMKNTSVSLGDHYTKFVNTQIQDGRYGSASEVLRAGLRLLEEQEIKLRALQAALIAGEESGPATIFDSQGFLKGKRGKCVG
jgi:antitoxin ParD1/3/4